MKITEILSLRLTIRWIDRTEWNAPWQGTDYLEWTALHENHTVSVACHCQSLPNGQRLRPECIDISSNVMMLDSQGYDAGLASTGHILLRLLEGQVRHFQAFSKATGARRPRAPKVW
jgi:hypothetical protein